MMSNVMKGDREREREKQRERYEPNVIEYSRHISLNFGGPHTKTPTMLLVSFASLPSNRVERRRSAMREIDS